MNDQAAPDPTEHSRWRPLRLLLEAMDADIARLYAEAQIDGLKPSWVMELLRLHAQGPMTIAEIEAEIPYPLSRVADDIAAALARKSFHDRITEKLAQDPAWLDE